MRLKSLELTANIAWSPAAQHPVYLATGTAAHQLDATFSTVSAINIFRLELGDRSSSMPLIGSVTSDERFNQLVWGGYGMGASGGRSAGVVVTAGDHGNLSVWDAKQLMSNSAGDDESQALIVQKTDHTGAVNALDFNTFQPNLLASGGGDSEILIWDLEKMEAPMTPGSKSQPPEDVLCLAWNKKVQHILASTFSNRCVVWDLKKNEPIIKVSDGMSRMKCKLVSWHPGIATQLCLSSEDDHTPVIQLWDLRFATSPVQSMEQHTKGVLAMSWCPRDPDLLLSCGKDNQMICWNPNAAQTGGEVVYQAQLPSQWVFDLAWCPRNPALVAASSFDGHVSLYSLMGGTSRPEQTPKRVSESFGESDDPFHTVTQPPASQSAALHMGCLRKAPSWMRRPCGARFAFGGKLITWGGAEAEASGDQQQQPVRQIHVSQVVTELEMIARARSLDTVVQENKFVEFCTMKADNATEEIEQEIWQFLKTSFSDDARSEYKMLLGFSQEDDIVSTTLQQLKEAEGEEADSSEQPEDDAAAFDALSRPDDESLDGALQQLSLDPSAGAPGAGVDRALAVALLTGRLEAAVDLCLRDGRLGEALILAVSGGAELFQSAQQRVLRRLAAAPASAGLARLIGALVARDWARLVTLCGAGNWRAGLACVLTYAAGDELSALCQRIGAALEACPGDDGEAASALRACLCYICAGSADRMVACWLRHARADSPLALQALVDKVVVLQHSMRLAAGGAASEPGPAAAAQMGRYAALLASQGLLDEALRYLGDEQEESLLLLRDRIYRGMGQPPPGVRPPPCLFPQAAPTAVGTQTTPGRPGRAASGGAGVGSSPARGHAAPTPAYIQPRVPPVAPSPGLGYGLPTASVATPPSAYPQPNIYTPSTISGSMPPPPPAPVGVKSQPQPQPQPPSTLGYPRVGTRDYNCSTGWNDPPVLKERKVPAESERASASPINNFYNPAAYLPDPQVPPTSAGRYPTPAGMLGHAGHTPGYGAYLPNGAPVAPGQTPAPPPGNFYNPATAPGPGPVPPTGGVPGRSRTTPPPGQFHHQQQLPPAQEPKAPLPAEHQEMERVLNQLLSLCKSGATSRQMKMKMDDVDRKLEALYDCIRLDKVSPSVLAGVHQVVAAVRVGDYNRAIAIINHIVETANFAEIRAFVPGLKVLMQSAAMMQIRVT